MNECILVVDDDPEIVRAIAILLEKEGYQVLKAYNGMEALEQAVNPALRLIVIDVMMPKLDGLSAVMKIREKRNLPIIVLSAKSEDSDKVLGLSMGADDYIAKPFHPQELVARVRSQLRRYTLTATELKIVDLLMRNLGRVFPAEEIYRRVWNEEAYATENTVMVHIRRIREKIELNPKEPEYLKVVWGIGYKIEKR